MPSSAAEGVPMTMSWPATKPTMNTSLTSGVASSKKVKLTTAEACPAAKAAAFVCEDKSCPTERDRKRQTDRVHVVQINIT